MSTIALKIGTLLVRTIAKPLANGVKARAKVHGPFRRACIGVAQVLHSTDVRLRRSLIGNEGTAKVRPLNDAKAIEMGANFLSESLLFAVAAGVVIFESVRSSRKATTRHENTAEDIALLKEEVAQLRAVISKLSPEDTPALNIVAYDSAPELVGSGQTTTADTTATAASAASEKFPGIRYDLKNNYIIIPTHNHPAVSNPDHDHHDNHIVSSIVSSLASTTTGTTSGCQHHRRRLSANLRSASRFLMSLESLCRW